ncbi:MAG: TatD family hydrolase [Desulfobacter sp.]|nr:MAG: TatD family hydrolase [Desulfobacter sp.]
MRFMDVHTHLHDPRIRADVSGIINRAKAAGVGLMATCATMEENFEETARLARENESVLPCFGVHPWFLDTLSKGWAQNLGTRLEAMPSAVGETGLDFMGRGADRDLQLAVFNAHLALARDLNRPVNIHIRKAWDPLIHILKKDGPFGAGGLIHSFSGSCELARVLEKYNLYISFSGAVTRPNAKKTIAALKGVSLDRILFETDTPDIYPSFEGVEQPSAHLNQPANLPGIVEIAAQRRKLGFEELADWGYSNALNLFNPIMQ